MKTKQDELLIQEIKSVLVAKKHLIKRRANGALKYDYLVPGGYYHEQWDWDAFFMGVGLAAEISSEAIYLRNWALNYIINADDTGYSPGCVTPKGPESGHRKFVMKPFLAQGTYLAGKFLSDFSWIKPHWNMLRKIVLYRENHLWSKKYDLGMWTNAMESGADDNVAAFGFPDKTVLSTDVNTYIYREYVAMAKLAEILGKKSDALFFKKRAVDIKKNIRQYLWNNEDSIFYNLNTETGEHIKRISLSCFLPLWESLAPEKEGKTSVTRYILSSNHLWSQYGVRTLSKGDREYNNVNRIKPYSNWQGPVWPIANYFYLHVLLNYGFQKEAVVLAKKIFEIINTDIKTTGGMHENYNAETGKPLAAPNFVSWNLLVGNMLDEAYSKDNPFAIS